LGQQRSQGVIGRRQVLIINNSGRPLRFEARTPWSRRPCWLHAGGDIILENVKLIRVAGADYSLEFKNRYVLLWDEQGGRAYVRRLVMGKLRSVRHSTAPQQAAVYEGRRNRRTFAASCGELTP
jgi:hypothetical protein